MTDYIKRAVELADGWEYEQDDIEPECIYLSAADGTYWHLDEESIPLTELPRILLDALAAQLVRQVDASDYTFSSNVDRGASVGLIKHIDGPDRTMNTIKAIVDSGVLGSRGRKN